MKIIQIEDHIIWCVLLSMKFSFQALYSSPESVWETRYAYVFLGIFLYISVLTHELERVRILGCMHAMSQL